MEALHGSRKGAETSLHANEHDQAFGTSGGMRVIGTQGAWAMGLWHT